MIEERSKDSSDILLMYIRQLEKSLDWLNRPSLRHVDVKPENIIITPAGEAVLGDLSLLKECGPVFQAATVEVIDEATEGQIVEAVAIPWLELVRRLKRDPSFLFQFINHPREFEQFLAATYKRAGCPEVILTPPSKDRGRDVIATWPGVGAIRIYDQAKAFAPHRRVEANDVRAMLGVLQIQKNVSKAVITTTAEFAPGVYDELKEFMPYRLELRDGHQLLDWLLKIVTERME